MRECFIHEWRTCKEQSDLKSPLNKLNFNTEPMSIKGPLCEHGFRKSYSPKEKEFRPHESHCLLMLKWTTILLCLEWGALEYCPVSVKMRWFCTVWICIVLQRFMRWRFYSQVAALLAGARNVRRWGLPRGSRPLRQCVIGNVHWKNVIGL